MLWLQNPSAATPTYVPLNFYEYPYQAEPTGLCATAEPHVHSTTTVRTQVQCHGLLVKRFPPAD